MDIVIYALLFELMVNAVFSAGFLKIKFINFTYDTGLKCDYFSKCDFIFHICIDDKKGPEDNINVCRYFSVKTKELNDTIIYLKKLPDIVLLKFLILDDDSYRMEEIDFLHSYLNLTPGNTSQVFLHNQTRISINFTVICKNNFFGPHCSKYCYVKDKDSQHFKCNHETGERECMTGWSGLSCNESIIFSTTENSSSYSYSNNPDASSSDFSDLILNEEIANLESLIVSSSPSEIYNVSVLSMETQLSENDDYITEKPIFIKPEVMLEEFTEKKIISTLLEMETVPTKSTQNEEESSFGSSTNSWKIGKRIINMKDEKYMQLESGQNEIFADEHIHKRGYNLLLVNGSVGNLMTVIHDVLRHEVGDEVANKLIVDVGIWNGILKYTIFTRNESLPRTVMEHVQRLQPNIENALAHLISTHHEAAANKTSPKRKGIPEWGIVLVIIAMVTTAIIGIRQAHKHCGTKTSVKPKELMEDHDNPEAAPNALPNVPLNFTNPIYVQP